MKEEPNFDVCTCDQMTDDDLHVCPYAQDVWNEHELPYEKCTLCTCCPYCEYQCALDI